MNQTQTKQTEAEQFTEFVTKFIDENPDTTGWDLYEELKGRIYKYRISYETGIDIILNETGL